MSGVRAVAAINAFSLALKLDGTLLAWGDGTSSYIGDGRSGDRHTPVQIMTHVSAIATGSSHSLALKTDGTLWAWGSNSHGQLGDSAIEYRVTPGRIFSGVRAVAAGFRHSLAVTADGTLLAWGDNSSGQLGDGTTVNRLTPTAVMTDIAAIAAGYAHSLAITAGGNLWSWGENGFGELGDGTTGGRSAPVFVLAGVRTIGAGYAQSLAVKTDDTLWTWGFSQCGKLGDCTSVNGGRPTQRLAGVRAVAGGHAHSLAAKLDGSVWAWGWDARHGQLGDGATTFRVAPYEVLAAATAVAAGRDHSMAIRPDGILLAWGDNDWAQQCDGTKHSRALPVPTMTGVIAVATASRHTLALKAGGKLWTCGDNTHGQLGDGNFGERIAPAAVLDSVIAVAAGSDFSLAVRQDDSLWVWGRNDFGQLGDGTTISRATPVRLLEQVRAIAAGETHALALKTDGTVWGWGSDAFGSGSQPSPLSPAPILTGVVAIAAGSGHSLAIKTDGTLWGWGRNEQGQLGGAAMLFAMPRLMTSGVKIIAAGRAQSLAITTDGTLLSWGAVRGTGTLSAAPEVTQQNPFLRNLKSISAGEWHALALNVDGRVFAWGINAEQQLGIARLEDSAQPILVRHPHATYAGSDLVIEYFNPTIRNGAGTPGIGHHFITASPEEAASIDSGGSGPGWARTGRTFRAWTDPGRAPAGAVGVCRFYARGPNSHFYTADSAECQSLRAANPSNDPAAGWSYEGIAFHTMPPAAGRCAVDYHPVYRSYNRRFSGNASENDSNHRLTPSYNDYQRSIRFFGFADEGIAFCSPVSSTPGGDLQVTFAYPGPTVQAGAPVTIDFLFGNNGAGHADGGTVFLGLPTEVADWRVNCVARNGAACPASNEVDRLREGKAIGAWPAGGTLEFSATGTAPQSDSGAVVLRFAATVANKSGSPDGVPGNDSPPQAQTAVKSASNCHAAVNPGAVRVGSGTQSTKVTLVIGNGCPWTALSDVPWISVMPASGSGDATLTLAVSGNTAATERSGFVSLAGKTVALTQSAITCSFSASPSLLVFPPAVGNGSVELTVPAGCDWSVQNNLAWVSISPMSGNGSAILSIIVQSNPVAAARDGIFSVGVLSIPISQAGTVQPAPPLTPTADPCASLRLQREGDQVTPSGLTGPLSFDVIADDLCAWSVQSKADWITVTQGASGKGSASVAFLVAPNLDTGARQGSLAIGRLTFTVNQLGHEVASQGGDSGGDGGGNGSGGSGGSSG